MLRLAAHTRIFALTSTRIFHKGIDGLVQVVRGDVGEDPLSGDLFCFFNRRYSQVKILVWDRNGFWLLRKRLERGKFERINVREPWVEIDRVRFAMLLEGLDIRTAKLRNHFVREVRIPPRGDDHQRSRTAQ